jgi:hypothetical protein
MRTVHVMLTTIAFTISSVAPADAQATGPWRIAEQTPGAQYTRIRHDAGAEINLYRIDQFGGRTPVQFIEAIQADAMRRAGCEPLTVGAVREAERGSFAAASSGAQQTCALLLIAGADGGGAYSVSVDSRTSPVGAHQNAIGLVRGLIAARANAARAGGGGSVAGGSRGGAGNAGVSRGSGGGGAATGPVASTTNGAVTPITGADAQLRVALAAIPASNRPFGMVLHLESDVVAGGMRFAPYMLFPNGYAVDECRSWNLATTAPTPAALHAAGTDCDVLRWRKVGNKYQLQDTDGDWFDEAEELADTRPFRPGQRVDYMMGNVGGAAVSGGLSTVNTLNSAEVRLTSAGEISLAEWNSATYIGVGGVYASSGPSSRGVRGQYMLDGHVLAIRDAAGVISYGLIFLKVESGKPYLYINGELYWQR